MRGKKGTCFGSDNEIAAKSDNGGNFTDADRSIFYRQENQLIDHGQSGAPSSPEVSGNPHIRLAFWPARPAAPLLRLSTAPIAIMVPGPGDAYETNTRFDPVAHLVCGG